MAASGKVAHAQQVAREHAETLVRLSQLSHYMLDHVESWTPSFIDNLTAEIRRGGLQAARALLDPFISGGPQFTDDDLRLLGLMFVRFPGAQPLLSLHERDSGLDAFVVASDSAIVVIFPGTSTPKDVFANLKFCKFSLSGDAGVSCVTGRSSARVHSGYWGVYTSKSSNETLLDLVLQESERHPEREILVTGYSLGAALATLCGMELSRRTEHEVNVVGFASPRVGNRGFRTLVQNQSNLHVLRVKNDQDPITRVPVAGYWHVGVLAWIRDGLVEFFADEPSDVGAYFLRLGAVLAEAVHVRDHKLSQYYKAVVRSWPLQPPTGA